MKRIILGVAAAVSLFGAISAGGSAFAQEAASSCSISGTAMLQGIPDTRDAVVPSVGKTIAGYGLQAKAAGCTIALVCVGDDNSEASRDIARQRCVVVRDQLVAGGFTKADIATSRKDPGGDYAAGAVYLSVL
jgi:hypothetical protein